MGKSSFTIQSQDREQIRPETSAEPTPGVVVAPDGALLSFLFVQSEQFFADRKSALQRTGEYRLLVAVLQDALECWFRYRNARRARERRLFQEISAWFSASNRDWLFTFECICDHLGIDPDYIRRGLRQWQMADSTLPSPRFQMTPVVTKQARRRHNGL